VKLDRHPRKHWCLATTLLAGLILAPALQRLSVASNPREALNPAAAPGTEMLGRLEGRWRVDMKILDQQGNWVPQDQQREWLWYYILDGHAIQDDFVVVFKDESGNSLRRVVGTNIRIYNAEEKRWHMAWISSKARRLAAFTAVNEGDRVIMRGVNDQGRDVRNTFFDISRDSFDWEQAWTFDDGASWLPVARIHATRLE
jgi:hypothetical protein